MIAYLKPLARIFTLAGALFVAAFSYAGDAPINAGKSTAGHAAGLAISGFDPVAYFVEGQPVEGSSDFTFEHDGAKWQFSSASNLAMFKANPAKYAPQYGGYCAYAVSQGSTAPIDPAAWTIHDDKLYLNYNAAIQSRWSRDIVKSISDGNANWPNVLN